MEQLKTFRHEIKYSISQSELFAIKYTLKDVMNIDRNIDGYMVRSLYFDSVDDIDLNEKLMGTIKRKKIRLRIYDPKSDKVKLEIKSKYDIHQLKETLIINKKDALQLINGNYDILLKYKNEVANKIYLEMRSNCYRPKVIIEYERIAFTTNTTTRVTIDFNIRKSNCCEDFFSENVNYLKVSSDNEAVLEVKFDSFLEPYIGQLLSNYISQNQAISKYLLGRY